MKCPDTDIFIDVFCMLTVGLYAVTGSHIRWCCQSSTVVCSSYTGHFSAYNFIWPFKK